jgi:hypothetical protein
VQAVASSFLTAANLNQTNQRKSPMVIELANQYIAVFAYALRPLTITLPNGPDYRVHQDTIFLASPNAAHKAALAGLCRAIESADSPGPNECDEALFAKHGARSFNIPFSNARLAVSIKLYKEPPAPIIFEALPKPPDTPPLPITGFELPR